MRKLLFSLLGIALFVYILLSIGLGQIAESLLKLDLLLFAFAVATLAIGMPIKGLKQKMLVSPFKPDTSLCENTKIWLVGFFFGTASPAKSGETVRAVYLKRAFGLSLGEGLAVVFTERVADIAVLLAFAFFGLFYIALPQEAAANLVLSLAAFLLVFVAVLVVLLKKELTGFLLGPFFKLFAPEKLKHGLKAGFNEFYSAIGAFKKNKPQSVKFGFFTVLSWVFVFLQFYILAFAVGIGLGLAFFAVIPIILIVEALPISIGGLGTREAASVVMLGFFGIAAPAAISFSLIVLLFNLVQAAAGFVLFNSMEKPL